MDMRTAIRKAREKGLAGTIRYLAGSTGKGADGTSGASGENDGLRLLLLTNRDSDNVGDQIIEACDISLIDTVIKNLGIKCQIDSRAASIVSKKYLQTKDKGLLAHPESLIQKSDLVVFGGAPMFNYLYQSFYERTAVTLELAQKYDKPVMFSAIGIERYDEENPKCQRLKKILNEDMVKQITTRDDFDALQRYRTNERITIGKVADPAVFCSEIFDQYKAEKTHKTKKIGIFILRQNGFVDNKIKFSREEAADLWLSIIQKVTEKGWDYELLTSGHFGDEAFLDELIRKYGVSDKKCIFNMNSPEKLVKMISSYDAIISCRLHPSIIAYSLGVPSLGIVWNPKVTGFYDSVGYGERVVAVQSGCVDVDGIIAKLEGIIAEGVQRQEGFLMSIYESLFYGIKHALGITEDVSPYTYDEVRENLPGYQKITGKKKEERLERKFRRVYKTCNDRFDKNLQLKERIEELETENKRLKKELKHANQN